MIEQFTIHFKRPMPVFPLPGCVLLPHGLLPLHIFEARYRQMTADALDSTGLIAMGLFEGEVSQKAYYDGAPPVRPFVCLGYCEQYKPLDDGRYLLMLRGLCRCRIIEEHPHEPYRTFFLEPIGVEPPDESDMAPHRQRLEALLHDSVLERVRGVEALHRLLDEDDVPTVALLDIVAMQLCDDPERRYTLLREPNAHRRATHLFDYLHALRDLTKSSSANRR